MILFPAIDIVGGKAVRLYKGDYDQMTVYSDHPEAIALDFKNCGANHIHIVDLEGARDGGTPNFDTVMKIKKESGLYCEIGGGIRSMEVVDRYLSAGIDRVILGTAAIKDEKFLGEAVKKYGDKIAVGADIKDGFIAVKGFLRLFHQRHHIAHAQDTAGHTIRVENLDIGKLFAGTGELDRLSGYRAHRQGGTAAGVTVELGKDDAVNVQLIIE